LFREQRDIVKLHHNVYQKPHINPVQEKIKLNALYLHPNQKKLLEIWKHS